ncbi:DUF1116 domain-containing protein [Azoarcus indigens]|uniref:Uncharacterized protein DUF1116 n=1 Tax=Azoarcus indigens TaxID=29545 RepID=A0A4R6DGJ1_9RHOO|nr:DUF1116 domain-containing protein [Azoarcus indigens]TDN43826.1 uncharacterized protein DUF1116 [Azoarcus indigens]
MNLETKAVPAPASHVAQGAPAGQGEGVAAAAAHCPRHATANCAPLARLAAVRPRWVAVRSAAEALGLAERTLLHAGPPYADPRQPAAPVLSSAVLCCLYEGWAGSEAEAEAMIADGRVRLLPAQSLDVVTPLAAVISPRTALVEVEDAASGRHAWSLLGSGAGPQLRFGSRDAAILERLRWRDEVLAPHLAGQLAAAPVELLPLALAGLAGGDDLHGRTTAATAELRALLQPWPGQDSAVATAVDAMLESTPLFFLTLWMAACHLALSVAADGADPASTLVVALAGNGSDCGIRLAGDPARWWTTAALPPAGPRLNPALKAKAAPLLGDSGCIDAAGFGAQALASADEVRSALAPWLPERWCERPPLQARSAHRGERGDGAGELRWTVLDAALIAAGPQPALATIAMVDAAGRAGLLGRGIAQVPAALFRRALAGLLHNALAGLERHDG